MTRSLVSSTNIKIVFIAVPSLWHPMKYLESGRILIYIDFAKFAHYRLLKIASTLHLLVLPQFAKPSEILVRREF